METIKSARTRFAPSPTGYMHVGNLRTALYAYLIAKGSGGQFLLRIEDTDQGRKIEGAVDVIYATLKETGLHWDEGPDIGGPVGPYIQSERMGLYKDYATQLADKDAAYYCFCAKEDKDETPGVITGYDRRCRDLSPDQVRENLDSGKPWVIRQKMPLEGKTTFSDVVYGEITVENAELEDQILIKSDGMPTYNFANVIDDHLMGITHVVRGNEYLSSSPKYNLLYQAFGWEVPVYIHCAPVMKNATEKLSKRHGDASYQDLIEKGYLTEAILNYVALLGWSPGGEEEIFSLAGLAEAFKVTGLSKSPAIFDTLKLNHINAQWIRGMDGERFHTLALPWLRRTLKRGDVDTRLLADLLHPRCEVLSDLPEKVDFFDVLPDYDTVLYEHKKMKTTRESSLDALRKLSPVLEGLSDWTHDGLHNAIFGLIETLGVKNGILLWPLRTALSGKGITPGGGLELALLLGKNDTLARMEDGIKRLSAELA
ncbi:MAG: glutamate--tRNA ligase [Oscillospiraceae bacterium]|nr:glutamate--tRNA ligase [Oscillospiraceae bacterium]